MSASEVQNPVINSPYEEPASHWEIHEHAPAKRIDGRRTPPHYPPHGRYPFAAHRRPRCVGEGETVVRRKLGEEFGQLGIVVDD